MDLTGRKILLVEDEPFIAMDVEAELIDAGATVVGPASSLAEAKTAASEQDIDGAILDIMLGRTEVFPAADILVERDIPFVFHSAHAEPAVLKETYPTAPLHRKPGKPDGLIRLLVSLLKD